MNQSEEFSDEFLNAFIDGELDDSERGRLLDRMRHDETLNARVCDLQKVRELLQHAYRHAPPPPQRDGSSPGHAISRFTTGIAAGLALSVGLAMGWTVHDYQQPRASLLDIAQSMQLNQSAAESGGTWRVVLHVTTADPYRLKTVLDETEDLLEQRSPQANQVAVEILTNGRGLDLLRADTSPFAARIQQLQAHYTNSLAFKACRNAINRLKREKNIDVTLLPEADVVPSAIGEVINRQRQGWAYVQI